MPDMARVRTILSESGVASVAITLPGPNVAMTPDAAVEFALSVLSAAYFARSEQAAFEYTKRHSINTQEFLRLLRDVDKN